MYDLNTLESAYDTTSTVLMIPRTPCTPNLVAPIPRNDHSRSQLQFIDIYVLHGESLLNAKT